MKICRICHKIVHNYDFQHGFSVTSFLSAAPGRPAGLEHLPNAFPLGRLLLADGQGQLQSPLLPSLLPLSTTLLLLLLHLSPPRPLHLPPVAPRLAHRPALRPDPGQRQAKGVAQELQRETEVSDVGEVTRITLLITIATKVGLIGGVQEQLAPGLNPRSAQRSCC